MESNREEWPQRDRVSRLVIKGIYGDYFSDEMVEKLIRRKGDVAMDEKSALRIHLSEMGAVAKMILHGFTAKKVKQRAEEIFEPLDEDERAAVHISIGIEHGRTPTESEAATRLNIPANVLNQLLASSEQKLKPEDESM